MRFLDSHRLPWRIDVRFHGRDEPAPAAVRILRRGRRSTGHAGIRIRIIRLDKAAGPDFTDRS